MWPKHQQKGEKSINMKNLPFRPKSSRQAGSVLVQQFAVKKVKFGSIVVNSDQTLVKSQDQGLIIKLGGKEEFGQLMTNLEASNFNFHAFKLLLECYWQSKCLNPIGPHLSYRCLISIGLFL